MGRYLCILLVLLSAFRAHAQVTIHSLDELLQFADKNSPAARQSYIQPLISRQETNIQSSALYPKLTAFSSGDYYPILAAQVIPAEVLGGQPGTYLKARFGLPYIFSAGVELSMPLINLEKWTQLSKSKAQYRQSQWSSKLALENLHLQLIQTYYQYLITKEVAGWNKENILTTSELVRVMEQRKTAGVLHPPDYNRSKNLLADAKAAGVNYDRSLQLSLNALQSLLGARDGEVTIADSISGFNWIAHPDFNDFTNRPAFQEVNARVDVAALAVKESRRSALPRLQLNGRYAYNAQSEFESGRNPVEFDVSNVGLRLDLPLFQGNYFRAQQKKSALLLQSVQTEQERVTAQLEEQQRNWQTYYRSALQKQEILKEKLDAAKDNLRIARLSIAENVMEFEEFNNLYVEYNRAYIEYLQNQSDGVLYYLLSTQKF